MLRQLPLQCFDTPNIRTKMHLLDEGYQLKNTTSLHFSDYWLILKRLLENHIISVLVKDHDTKGLNN